MRLSTRLEVYPRLAAAGALLLICAGGCAPRHVQWADSGRTVEPQPVVAASPAAQQGYLVIELPPTVGRPGDVEPQHFPPVYVYDQHGRYIRELSNNTEYPTALTPGEYIVLVGETDPLGVFHQVQVRVADGQTTAVSLADIERAPSFWQLPREFPN